MRAVNAGTRLVHGLPPGLLRPVNTPDVHLELASHATEMSRDRYASFYAVGPLGLIKVFECPCKAAPAPKL